jgi:hypothetical protein
MDHRGGVEPDQRDGVEVDQRVGAEIAAMDQPLGLLSISRRASVSDGQLEPADGVASRSSAPEA